MNVLSIWKNILNKKVLLLQRDKLVYLFFALYIVSLKDGEWERERLAKQRDCDDLKVCVMSSKRSADISSFIFFYV
jgi:hypothetical protein